MSLGLAEHLYYRQVAASTNIDPRRPGLVCSSRWLRWRLSGVRGQILQLLQLARIRLTDSPTTIEFITSPQMRDFGAGWQLEQGRACGKSVQDDVGGQLQVAGSFGLSRRAHAERIKSSCRILLAILLAYKGRRHWHEVDYKEQSWHRSRVLRKVRNCITNRYSRLELVTRFLYEFGNTLCSALFPPYTQLFNRDNAALPF